MKVLLVAPFFAPYTEVSAIRMISLANQLVEDNHSVDVLCYSKEMLLRLTEEKNLKASIPENVKIINFTITQRNVPAFTELMLGFSFERVFKTLDISKYEVVLLSLGPFYTMQIANYLRKKKKPYVLDFRDLGAIAIRPKREDVKDAKSLPVQILKKVFLHLLLMREKNAVDKANAIVVVSEIDRRIMQKAYSIPSNKLVLASNGFDEDKLRQIKLEERNDNEIIVGVFGKFMYYSIERAMGLLRVVNKLRNEGIPIKVLHIGQEYPWIMKNIIRENLIIDIYDARGIMPYDRGMALLGSCDFFMVEDTSPDDIGTKIYDYIYFNKPVVASVPKDIPLAELVGKFSNGFVCDNDNDIEKAMRKIIDLNLKKLDESISPSDYSRRQQNSNIIDCLKNNCKQE